MLHTIWLRWSHLHGKFHLGRFLLVPLLLAAALSWLAFLVAVALR